MLASLLLNVVLIGLVLGLGIALRHARSRQQEQHHVIVKLRFDNAQASRNAEKVRDAIARCRSRLDAGIST